MVTPEAYAGPAAASYLDGTASVGGCSVSQLSRIIYSPSEQQTVASYGCGMQSSGTDAGPAAASYLDGTVSVGGCSVSQLSITIASPSEQ